MILAAQKRLGFCFTAALLALRTGTSGADTGPAVTKVELILIASDLQSDDAAARPKTIYLAGDRYARIEQFADANSQVKHLIIVNEPDIWLVDGVRRTAGHSVNYGSDLVVHNPILGPDGPDELMGLEYGRELDFFEKTRADHLKVQNRDGILCNVREFLGGGYRITLYQNRSTKMPIEMQVSKEERRLVTIRYVSYQTGLPFEQSLFEPPLGMTMIEANQ